MMAEPSTKADRINQLFPWLWHWTIADERIGGFRSDAFALKTPDGVVVIDALPLTASAMAELQDVCAVVMTHGNHQRSVWRFRKELNVPVYAPSDVHDLDEEPDILIDEGSPLPGGLRTIRATGFSDACYLVYAHEDGTGVLFCGDLICHDPGGPYRFPVEPSY
jgi:glyoxylase-like metal-dependent hydrolase (beta-lactamase superfamily II)